jgi:Icc-related predicted phosphoesterase
VIRIAAVGDVHVGEDTRGRLREAWRHLDEQADVLLIAGDLTRCGTAEEARILADELAGVEIPVVAVLGNHDHHADETGKIRHVLESAGVCLLEGENAVIPVGEQRLGVAGTKGFGGGFAGACTSEFGEPETKAFARHARDVADTLVAALAGLDCDVKVALTHYAPVPDTLVGERLEIYPFLGSYLLGEAIDEAGANLALHGHAHGGSEKGVTPGGVSVRNVAQPVIRQAYALYTIG